MQWFGLALDEKKVYYTTLESSFKIPFVRRLIKLLRAIPIPTEAKNKPYFIEALDNALQEGNIIHFYPEASLWTYYHKLRKFKTGAFHFAVRNQVPIVPMVITFRRPQGLRRILKRKSDVTLTILKPVNPQKGEDIRQEIEDLQKEVYEKMEYVIQEKKGKNNIVK